MNEKKDLELYIHIPFCIKKCKYCDFLSAPATKKEIEGYCHNLQREIENYGKQTEYFLKDYQVKTIFIGGGTPSSIDSFYIKRIMRNLEQVFSFAPKSELEVSMEVNPGTLTRKKLEDYKAAGINRLSMGLQSADEEELRCLGRVHTFLEFLENYKLARMCGFQNINIDLMSALPGQTVASWRQTLEKVIELNPEHISAYSLIIEEGTPFYEAYANHEELLPEEEADRQMYYLTKEILKENGYERYEISNYAKKGYACRHNLGYWDRTSYLGLGLGASSLIEETRFSNPVTFDEYESYINGKQISKEQLSLREQMEEFMFLGLRKSCGVRKNDFLKKFGISIEKVYGTILDTAQRQGFLENGQDMIELTNQGIDLSNVVLAEFLFEETEEGACYDK